MSDQGNNENNRMKDILTYDAADPNIDYLALALEALKHGKIYEGPDAWEQFAKDVGKKNCR